MFEEFTKLWNAVLVFCFYDYSRNEFSLLFSMTRSSMWPSESPATSFKHLRVYLLRTNGGASSLIDRFRLIRVSAAHFKTGLTVLCAFTRVARCGFFSFFFLLEHYSSNKSSVMKSANLPLFGWKSRKKVGLPIIRK